MPEHRPELRPPGLLRDQQERFEQFDSDRQRMLRVDPVGQAREAYCAIPPSNPGFRYAPDYLVLGPDGKDSLRLPGAGFNINWFESVPGPRPGQYGVAGDEEAALNEVMGPPDFGPDDYFPETIVPGETDLENAVANAEICGMAESETDLTGRIIHPHPEPNVISDSPGVYQAQLEESQDTPEYDYSWGWDRG